MKRPFATSLLLGAVLVLSACGSDDNAAEQDNAAAVATETAGASNPFADSEMKMNERMMAAVGTDVGDTWVLQMIEHHQGAIDMSRIMLQQNPSDHVAQMAQETIDKQTKEIEDLRRLKKDGNPDQASAEPYASAMRSMEQAMMSATGADVEETFMRKMLAHHEGGVALSEVALENGASGEVRARATKTREDQQKEAEMVESMLRGEPMPAFAPSQASGPAPSAPAARASQAAPRPTPTASARPQATATQAPAEAEDPHAGMDMSRQ